MLLGPGYYRIIVGRIDAAGDTGVCFFTAGLIETVGTTGLTLALIVLVGIYDFICFRVVGITVAPVVTVALAVGLTAAAYIGRPVTEGRADADGLYVLCFTLVGIGVTDGLDILCFTLVVGFAVTFGDTVAFKPGGGLALNSFGYLGVKEAPGGGDTGPSVTLTGNLGLPCCASAIPLKGPRTRTVSVITNSICTIFNLDHPLCYCYKIKGLFIIILRYKLTTVR